MGWVRSVRLKTLFLIGLTFSVVACGEGQPTAPSAQPSKALEAGGASDRDTIGLYSSLPILWSEADDIRDHLSGDFHEHWVLEALRERGKVGALDALTDLPAFKGKVLVLAQPRPLSPDENVVLDDWVRAGGRVLLFVDPMLTAHSHYSLGDPRRPQDVAMLSPILTRWGIALEFDEDQPLGLRQVNSRFGVFPVDLPGRFRLLSSASGMRGDARALEDASAGKQSCKLQDEGLVAYCSVGAGRVLAVADAALLDDSGLELPASRAVLLRVLDEVAE